MFIIIKICLNLFYKIVIAVVCCAGKSIEGPRRALVTIQGIDVNGKIMMEQASINSPVKIYGTIYGMEPGLHALHIHTGSQLGDQCSAVGTQFVPVDKRENEKSGFLGMIKVNMNICF